MKTLLSLILCTLITSCAVDQRKKVTKKANIFYNQGTQELADQEYTLALNHLRQANELEPNNTLILNNLGMAYYFKGATQKAIQHIEEAIKVDSKNTSARMNLATINMNNKDYKNAESQYFKILQDLTYLAQFRTYYNLGVLKLAQKRDLEALKYFEKSVKENETFCPAHFQIGNYYYKRKNYKKALKKYTDASFGTCYNNPAPHYLQAKTNLKLGNIARARKSLNLIIDKFSSSKYFKVALRDLRRVGKVEDFEVQSEKLRSRVKKRKILTPDF